MSTGNARCKIFVGNIPYGASEEKLRELLGLVGPIVSFEMKKNPDGKPSGYGFCEYRDPETVEAAMKKFQNFDFYGRQLKIGYSNQARLQKNDQNVSQERMKSSEDTLAECLESFTKREIWTFVSQMKSFVEQSPEQARIILQDYPQLAKALLLAQVKLEMVSKVQHYDKRKMDQRYEANKQRKFNGMNDIHANSYNSQLPPQAPPMQGGISSSYMPYYAPPPPPPPPRGGNDWYDRNRGNDISDPRLRNRDPRMNDRNQQIPPPPPYSR